MQVKNKDQPQKTTSTNAAPSSRSLQNIATKTILLVARIIAAIATFILNIIQRIPLTGLLVKLIQSATSFIVYILRPARESRLATYIRSRVIIPLREKRTLGGLVSVYTIVQFIIWCIGWGAFVRIEFGAIYFIISTMCFIYVNTSTEGRRDGVPSAYSVFNPGNERIGGTFTAEQFERQLRYGQLWLIIIS